MKPFDIHVTSSSTTIPVQLSPSPLRFQSATFVGVASFDAYGRGVANTSTAHLGLTRNRIALEVKAGKDISVSAPPGEFYDLRDFWFLPQTANDGVCVYLTA